jgi:hypothetical protein
MNYNEKVALDTWSKQTQTKPISNWRKPCLTARAKSSWLKAKIAVIIIILIVDGLRTMNY